VHSPDSLSGPTMSRHSNSRNSTACDASVARRCHSQFLASFPPRLTAIPRLVGSGGATSCLSAILHHRGGGNKRSGGRPRQETAAQETTRPLPDARAPLAGLELRERRAVHGRQAGEVGEAQAPLLPRPGWYTQRVAVARAPTDSLAGCRGPAICGVLADQRPAAGVTSGGTSPR
jgi:hypothetical protein